jgi:ubiquinone/menaquinone biosynthesis C-methylase UbiE
MEPILQRRVQRYGWDRAAPDYEPLWQAQLAGAQRRLLQCASLVPGERVLDVACGTGLVTFRAAEAVGRNGRVLGIDLSGQMIETARRGAEQREAPQASFARMDAEALSLSAASFDVALCSLGLMYMPDPAKAVREMRRVLRPGGRLVVSVWGERSACGWAAVFPIIDAEVASEVCPLFFSLGHKGALAYLCSEAGFEVLQQHRLATVLAYADPEEACDAALIGGPVALAWSRFANPVRARVRQRYVEAIAPWKEERGYRIPAEFVVLAGVLRPDGAVSGAPTPGSTAPV